MSIGKNGDRLILLGTQGGPVIHSYKTTHSANVKVYKNITMVIDTGYGVIEALSKRRSNAPGLRESILHIIHKLKT